VVRSILVVDDDTAVRGLIVRILRSGGHVVVGEPSELVADVLMSLVGRPRPAISTNP
jgi:CheY-like chemotaxis protein